MLVGLGAMRERRGVGGGWLLFVVSFSGHAASGSYFPTDSPMSLSHGDHMYQKLASTSTGVAPADFNQYFATPPRENVSRKQLPPRSSDLSGLGAGWDSWKNAKNWLTKAKKGEGDGGCGGEAKVVMPKKEDPPGCIVWFASVVYRFFNSAVFHPVRTALESASRLDLDPTGETKRRAKKWERYVQSLLLKAK